MPVQNPALGKVGGGPESAIVPKSLGGAGSISTNPTTIAQQERLSDYLFNKTRQQYEAQLRTLANHYGLAVTGRVTDPVILDALQARATWAANSITQTAAHDVANSDLSKAEVFQARNQFKPEQIFTTETNTASQQALQDFYTKNPALAAANTFHVEPTDSSGDECQSWIDLGSVKLTDLPDFPLHVGCPHGNQPDAPIDNPFAGVMAANLQGANSPWMGGLSVWSAPGNHGADMVGAQQSANASSAPFTSAGADDGSAEAGEDATPSGGLPTAIGETAATLFPAGAARPSHHRPTVAEPQGRQ